MQSAHQAYRRMQAETASPGELIVMLYDALLRHLNRAESGLERRDVEVAHASMVRAQDIVLELMASLDLEDAGEAGAMARQIAPLYEYMYRRLLDASLQKDTTPVAEVRRLVMPLREAWGHAIEQVARDAAAAGRGRERRRG
jgi:flagellar protein FliS